jgi:Flp pilus assembly pilin Flp
MECTRIALPVISLPASRREVNKQEISMREYIELQTRRMVNLFEDRKGVSSLEYGVLALAIVTAIYTGAQTFGTAISTFFTTLATTLHLN